MNEEEISEVQGIIGADMNALYHKIDEKCGLDEKQKIIFYEEVENFSKGYLARLKE